MTNTATFPLGAPLSANQRGGDARARDLAQGRDVRGPHYFAASADCQLTNGMLRVVVGDSGAAPSLTISTFRGPVPVGDAISDVLSDTLEGSIGTPEWFDMCSVVIDSLTIAPILTAVQLVRASPEVVIARLVVAAIGDVFLTLRRGEPVVHIQHGATRGWMVETARRVRVTDPVMAAVIAPGRVEEPMPTEDTLFRFVAAVDGATADGDAFSVTTPTMVRSALFVVGVGSGEPRLTPTDLHHQSAGVATRRAINVAMT